MQEQTIANIILSDILNKNVSAKSNTDNKVISEVVESWNKNIYIIPKQSLKFQKRRAKKYDFM